ncbi:ABC-type nitrate/sulfonate/bicarbonate transport system substrate-binding protein [Martelella mediterranea]|uniref:Thiamine pyrimidine synthase n=2 Tax=Martelella mediterranea TaxID=293089 RepID=A0A4R3NX94_9HYPH|nr:ABC-type nitrate/sulfonate/bicarbonate transport system substrate-binding protein [Martelella mediterranea]
MTVMTLTGGAHAADNVTVALDWTPNTNHIGLYVAKAEGFYDKAGLDVDILPYSDTSSGTLVSNGIAGFGIAGPIAVITQRTAGADIKAVYAIVQHETGRLVFNADREDIQSPKDLDGKVFAGFGGIWNKIVRDMIINDGGDGDFETVTLGTSAYEALANGQVDFTLDIATWEGVNAALEGQEQRSFTYSDYGVPGQQTTMIISSDAYLNDNPETARSFLAATLEGYRWAAENPDKAADILMEANPSVLTNAALVHGSMEALVDGRYLIAEDGTIGTIDPKRFNALGAYLTEAGVLQDESGATISDAPDFTPYFSNDYLPE